jgi:UDP-N-acetylmuramate-alanine ligase
MMKNNDCNGWTNRQTWNINLQYGEIFTNMCEEHEYDDVDHLAEAFNDIVAELELNDLKVGTLAYQAVEEYLNQVNWEEIAEHYANDFDLFQEEEEEVEA